MDCDSSTSTGGRVLTPVEVRQGYVAPTIGEIICLGNKQYRIVGFTPPTFEQTISRSNGPGTFPSSFGGQIHVEEIE